jgi:hypothetical protein
VEPVPKIMDRALALISYIASAGITAFLAALFIHYALGVPPVALRFDALISAGLLGLLLLVAMTTVHEREK